jgi:cation diffusion facilitator CzcD-associated flavoprotein CzcO
MRAAGLKVAVLEKAGNVDAVWRRHYDCLHLHTDRNHSGLPGMAKAYALRADS